MMSDNQINLFKKLQTNLSYVIIKIHEVFKFFVLQDNNAKPYINDHLKSEMQIRNILLLKYFVST